MAEGADGKTGDHDDKAGSATVPPATATSETKAESEGEPAWPPREAAPEGDAKAAAKPDPVELLTSAPPPGGDTDARAETERAERTEKDAKAAVTVMPPTEADAQGGAGAALPGQEMGFSESTLHWLAGGETTGTTRVTRETGSLPSYDPRAPVAGRKRAVLVVGGAGLLALIVAGTLFVQARGHRAPEVTAPAAAEPARDLTARAEAAYAANRISEAIELAHLALSADARYADAHFVMANCERARNQISAAREQYRKYLDLAPLGLHAAAAREALGSLPQ
jgi:hypothetical protein